MCMRIWKLIDIIQLTSTKSKNFLIGMICNELFETEEQRVDLNCP